MATPGSAPFTSPGNPGPDRQSRRTPTATPGPRGALQGTTLPASVPVRATRADYDAARRALNEITGRTPEPAHPIADSDARQLGLSVSPPSALINLRPAWVQDYINDASDDELLAIGALHGIPRAGQHPAQGLRQLPGQQRGDAPCPNRRPGVRQVQNAGWGCLNHIWGTGRPRSFGPR